MAQQSPGDVIRDARRQHFFIIDNAVLDCYAKEIGITAYAVYTALVRHANQEDKSCFPSIPTIAEELGASENTIRTAIRKLEKSGLIHKTPNSRTEEGKTRHFSHTYTILPVPPANIEVPPGSISEPPPSNFAPPPSKTDPPGSKFEPEQDLKNKTHGTRPNEQDHLAATTSPRKKVEKVVDLAERTPRIRAPDELWDTLKEMLGYEPKTQIERGKWNAALKQLRDVGATPAEMRSRITAYREKWATMPCTPMALAANWSLFQGVSYANQQSQAATRAAKDADLAAESAQLKAERLAKWGKPTLAITPTNHRRSSSS